MQYWVCTAAVFVAIRSLFCEAQGLDCNNNQGTIFAQQNICSLSEGLRLDGRNHFSSSGHFANVHDGILCDVFRDLKCENFTETFSYTTRKYFSLAVNRKKP